MTHLLDFDAETGLHYNRSRYYDPDAGRFIRQDPPGLAGGINLYQYAPNPLFVPNPTGGTSQHGTI
ncbi:TPA: RHS repeat-associated core domain-containing protein [Cronobacter dublinensis]